ncbi:unnamed protein product [Lactuca saligna]|uniref:Uncharacterized protein n=1 Tax=Lactuca saligna TaxID=75948 RepID=A0AA36E0G8_LACSI|nr:unnamed protein product [Lactuca saligna]
MFKDDHTSISVVLILAVFNLLQKPSSLKPHYSFGLSYSSEELEEDENVEGNKHSSPPPKDNLKGDQENQVQGTLVDDSRPLEPNDDGNEDDKKSKSSTSDTGSSDENVADPFSMLEVRDRIVFSNSKVDKVDLKVIGLDMKLDQKVTNLDSKLKLMLKYLSEIQYAAPLKLNRPNQLNHLISLCLKRTINEVEQKYNDSLDHHISTTTIMLKIHDDMIIATNKLIKYTHVHHEKQIQRIEKEICQKYAMNMVMSEVLINRIRSTYNILDVLDHKFDEIFVILDETFAHLKA